MLNKKTSLFSLDLRIEQDIIKLKVYEEDAVTDIVDRFFGSLSLKSSSKDKLKSKLEEQFRKILQKKELSQVIKNKLESLLDESKIVIMAIHTDKNEPSLNETPFKILQESVMNGRKTSQQKIKRNYNYLEEDNTNLNLKYQSQVNNQNQRVYLKDGDSKFDNVILQTKNVSPQKLSSQIIRQLDKSQQLVQKNNNQDTKWTNSAYKTTNRNQNYYRQGAPNIEPQKNAYQTNPVEKVLEEKLGIKSYISKNDYKSRQIQDKHFQRSNSVKIAQFLDQPCNNETFHQYKMNRYKSNSNNYIVQQIPNQSSYHPVSSREYVRPSKSSARLNYTGQNTSNTIRNYDNPNFCTTIRNYDTLLNTKSLNGAVSSKNLKGKFNYLVNE